MLPKNPDYSTSHPNVAPPFHLIRLLIKAGISASLIGVVLWGIDLESLRGHFHQISLSHLALAVIAATALLLLQGPLLAWRWLRITKRLGYPLTLGEAVRLTFIGLFFNQTLPASIGGDALRAWFAYQIGLPLRQAINSVLLERLSGLLALILLMVLGLFFIWQDIESSPLGLLLLSALPLALCGLTALYLVHYLPEPLLRLPVFQALAAFAEDTGQIMTATGLLIELMALGILSNLLAIGAVYVLGETLGLGLTPFQYLSLIPAVILCTIIPVSIAGWGLREGAMVVVLGAVGASAEVSFTVSVLFGAALIAAALPGGALWSVRSPSNRVVKNPPSRSR